MTGRVPWTAGLLFALALALAPALAACDLDDTGSLELFSENVPRDHDDGSAPRDAAGGAGDAGDPCPGDGACECREDDDCADPFPRCDVAAGACVQCADHPHCADGLRCDARSHTCQPGCRTDADCTSTIVPRCLSTSGACVQCLGDVDCVGQFHSMCLVTQSRCEECHFDVQCPAGQACNALEGRCH